MQFFTDSEFKSKYSEFATVTIPTWQIEAVCEIIFSQVSLRYRDASWDISSVPLPVKKASMEQLRFMLETDIPFIDTKDRISAGSMNADLNTDYSTLSLRMLANAGLLYRGSRMSDNMALSLPFGN